MRHILVILHRWFGLATALFLFVAGLTGALIILRPGFNEFSILFLWISVIKT